MDFRQLEYFQAVVQEGSISSAAKSLGLTQPPLSGAISKLERDLGVQLLERTSKGVHPTEAGLVLLTHGAKLVSDRASLCRTLGMMGQGLQGHLRIGVEQVVIDAVVADVLGEFMVQAPDVHVSLTDTSPDLIVRGISQGEIDVGCLPFAPEQFSAAAREQCDFLYVGTIPIKLAVPRGRFLEMHPDGIGWGRWIVPHRLAMFSGFPDAVEQALGGIDDTYDTIEVSTPQTCVSLVAARLGVALMTEQLAAWHPGIVCLEPPDWAPALGTTLVWRRDARVTPLMEHWIEVVRTTFAAQS